jgi:hypothetical protein
MWCRWLGNGVVSSRIGIVWRHGWPASQPAWPRAALTSAQSGAPRLNSVRSLLPAWLAAGRPLSGLGGISPKADPRRSRASSLGAAGLRPSCWLRVRGDLGNLDLRCLYQRYGDRLHRRYGPELGSKRAAADGAPASSVSPKSASEAEGPAAGPAGVILSKNRSSSTGTGMTRVLFFSPATSTTVCSSRSCSAAGSRAITFAAAASRLDAWYSPSAVMILARRSCRTGTRCPARTAAPSSVNGQPRPWRTRKVPRI